MGEALGSNPLASLQSAHAFAWQRAERLALRVQTAVRKAEAHAGITSADDAWCKPYVFDRWRDLIHAGDIGAQHVDELLGDIQRIEAGGGWRVAPGAFINRRGKDIVGPRWILQHRERSQS